MQALDAFYAFEEGYHDLAREACDRGVQLWRTRPKFHSLGHMVLAIEQTSLNPRFWAVWMDEDLQGKLRNVSEPEKIVATAAMAPSWQWHLRRQRQWQ